MAARSAVLLASLAVLVSVPFDLVPWLRGPAPYPPEWQWAYRPEGPARPLLGAAACALGVLLLVAASGTAWARRHPVVARRTLVAGAVLLGCGFQITLLAREPGNPLRTLLSRARSPSFTSYHAVALSPEAHDPVVFLRSHAERLPELARTAKHAATHPPGPVLYYRLALEVCERLPWLTDRLLWAAGLPDRQFSPPATRAGRAAALCGALLLGLMGALTAWPIAALGRGLGLEDLGAARLAALWALIPGPALMTPQFDQALALPVAGATALLLAAGRSSGPWRAGLAGLLGGIAVSTSYGAAAFLLVGGLAALAARGSLRTGWKRLVAEGSLAVAVAGTVAFGVPALLGHQPLRALVTALSIHRETYTAPRSYLVWLFFNPLDLALFLGIPVALGGLFLLARSLSSRGAGETRLTRFRLAMFAGVGLLLVLGVTRGEVGRLWIPLMPMLLVGSVGAVDAPRTRDALAGGALLAALTLVVAGYWIT